MMFLLVGSFALGTASGQANAFINILTQNSGQVALGGTVFIQVDIGNTGPTSSIGVNKVRAQISVPSAIVTVVASGSQTGLPPGWIITSNTGSAITVCNGTDVIAVGTQRTILIAVQGTALGGPSTVAGVLSFGPGTGVCTGPGSLAGDNTADNTSTSSITVIPAPACGLSLTAAAGAIACNGGTATLTATASGASGAVEYSLNGGAFQSGNTFTVNAAGSPYTVTVREVATPACNATSNVVTVTEPTAVTASASAGTIACNGGTTTLTVTASGGTGALEYSLNGGAYQAGNTFTVNAAGSPYTVTVRDASACTGTSNTVTVSQPTAISASASAGTIACNGGTTTLTVTASGGSGALEYSVNGGAFQAGNTFTVNAAGSPYIVTARDANTCTATTNSVTVTQPTALTASASSTPVTTIGGSDGTATATPSGGTSPYTYSWNSTPVQTTATATGLPAGSYTVTVTDANACTTTANTTVSSPSCSLAASAAAGSITCFGGTTTLTVTPTGAAGAVEYSLNGGAFQSGNTFTVNAAGSPYTVTAREVATPSCTATSNAVTVTEPTALVATSSAPPIALPGQSTTVTVGASGGTAPYTGTGTFTRTAGTYTFTVTDANGCSSNTDITLTDPTPGPANAIINVLTLNSGTTAVGQTVDVQISVGNTGPGFIGVNKVRAQVSVPIAIATALPNADQTGLPPGWIITNNTGGSITVCNGTDNIPAGEQRQVLIKVQGTAVGGPSTIAGVISFGPGTGVCTGPGSLAGDNTADNTSTSTITVTATLPVSLTDFTAKLVNCQPALHWVTEAEVDFDRFEIERSLVTGSWTTVGTVKANGTNTTTKLQYGFTDKDLNTTAEKVSYRLKLIDKDGHYKYSRILLVYINCNTIQARVYPNPTEEGRLYVSLTGVDKNAEASLLSLSGQVLLKTKVSAGTNSINVSGIADGTYILDIRDEKGFNKKFKVFIHN
jgi:hypothetical protein